MTLIKKEVATTVTKENNNYVELYFDTDLDLFCYRDRDGVATAIPVGQSGGSEYTETIVNISSAQILAMGTTPIELLPAAGVGKYYDIEKVILEYTNVTTAYSLAIDYLQIEYNNNTYANLNKSIITQSDNALDIIKNGQENDGTSEVNFTYGNSGMLNQNVRLKVYNSSTNPTLGDGTLRVKIYHKTITFGA